MTLTATLSPPTLTVEPGGTAECKVTLHNGGTVVDRLSLRVLGDAQTWARAEPPTVSVLPGDIAETTLVFSPPRHWRPTAGDVPFAVGVTSREQPDASVAEEGVLQLTPYDAIDAELVPRTARARRSARLRLAIDNRGNRATTVELIPAVPDARLALRFAPADSLRIDPGTARIVTVTARPVKRFARGPNRTIPFEIAVNPQTGEPCVVSGGVVQQATLPPWLLPLIAGACGVAALLLLAWLLLLRPTVTSAATDAARLEAASVAQQAREVQERATQAREAAADTRRDAIETTREHLAQQTPTPPEPMQIRVSADAVSTQPGRYQSFAATPQGEEGTFEVRDILVQNPNGDRGFVQVRRGDAVLLTFGLASFRDLPYHVIEPLRFGPGEPIVLAVDCRNEPPARCTASATFVGVRS